MYSWTSETRKMLEEIEPYMGDNGLDPRAPKEIKEKLEKLKKQLMEDTLKSGEIV